MNIYYSIRKSDGTSINVEANPVDAIMKTDGVQFYSMGIYQTGDDFICLMHIFKWEYDMLDAFGIDEMTNRQFSRKYKLSTAFSIDHKFTGVEILG